jgi:diguanylate cyclase (GGDEF)-like protein
VTCSAALGGEELGVLLPDTDQAGAMVVAERARAAVAASSVPSGEVGGTDARASIRVTISLGVAQLRGDDSSETLMKRADRVPYAAKDLGRDRVQA